MPTGTRISNPTECNKYYECRNNQRLELVCGQNEAFDLVTNQCRAANAVNCGTRGGVSSRNPQTNAVNFFLQFLIHIEIL
jgi:hypothetical protein